MSAEVASFCFPHGVQPVLLERTPSMSSLNEIIYGQQFLHSDACSFIFLMKVFSFAVLKYTSEKECQPLQRLSQSHSIIGHTIGAILLLACEVQQIAFAALMFSQSVIPFVLWQSKQKGRLSAYWTRLDELEKINVCRWQTICLCMESAATWMNWCIGLQQS